MHALVFLIEHVVVELVMGDEETELQKSMFVFERDKVRSVGAIVVGMGPLRPVPCAKKERYGTVRRPAGMDPVRFGLSDKSIHEKPLQEPQVAGMLPFSRVSLRYQETTVLAKQMAGGDPLMSVVSRKTCIDDVA